MESEVRVTFPIDRRVKLNIVRHEELYANFEKPGDCR
jgi:hypothetical protein